MPSSAVSSIQCLDGSKIIIPACLEALLSYHKFQVFNFFSSSTTRRVRANLKPPRKSLQSPRIKSLLIA